MPWAKSKAKELLFQDIVAGKAEGSNRAIYNSRPDYAATQPNFKNFSQSVSRLRKFIATHQARADEDAAALANDVLERPRALVDPRGYPRWDTSKASDLLKQDIADGKHDEMAPKMLWQSRDEYKKVFPLEVFRDHIHQELRAIREKAYWWPRMYALLEPEGTTEDDSDEAEPVPEPAHEPDEAAATETDDWYD